MALGQASPLFLVALNISRSKSVKFLIALITPEEDQAATAEFGYAVLNHAERAPGYEPPMVTHFLVAAPNVELR